MTLPQMIPYTQKSLIFHNTLINKRKLQELMSQTFHNCGIVESALIADRVKNLTFHYATKSGISLNAEDLRVPFRKGNVIGLTSAEVEETERRYETGTITSVERFQKVIDIWNNASNRLKDDVLTYFRESDPLNSLYIMAFSGARGNISQVRQLVGMRGLMANPQGQIIDLPIKSNFREGLKVTEYVISSYGARKGLVDTALRTADSGYLTRRLVDVAQDIIVREDDCLTTDSLSYEDLFETYANDTSLKDKLIGRLTAKPIITKNNRILARANTPFTSQLIYEVEKFGVKEIFVRSPLTCNSKRSICRKCYGWHLSYSRIVDLGEAVGIIAAQSIGEPGTQLTMRTFHTGGVFSGDLTKQIRAPFLGTIFYKIASETKMVRTMHGEKGFRLNENVTIVIENKQGVRISLVIPAGNTLLVNNLQKVYAGQILAEIKKDANLIIEEDTRNVYADVSGEIFFQNLDYEKILNKQGAFNRINKRSGLIWVLNGERYILPSFTRLRIPIGQTITTHKALAQYPISNSSSGIVKFEKSKSGTTAKILNFSLIFTNVIVESLSDPALTIIKIAEKKSEKKFILNVKASETLVPNQPFASLQDDLYTTKTGGHLFYNLESANTKKNIKPKSKFSGSLYWIPEETYILNSSILHTLQVKVGCKISSGKELWPGTYSKLGGLVRLDETINELTITPGELFLLQRNVEHLYTRIEKNCFVKPGEFIMPGYIAKKLCYVEYLEIGNTSYLLARPVQTFQIPLEKGFVLRSRIFSSNQQRNMQVKVVKRVLLKNEEQIKSSNSINLLQTSLFFHLPEKNKKLQPRLELIKPVNKKNSAKLKISLYENFNPPTTFSNNFISLNFNISAVRNYIVKENQFVLANSIIAQEQILSCVDVLVLGFHSTKNNVKEILLLRKDELKEIEWKASTDTLQVKPGDLIRQGSQLTTNLYSPYSGQIYDVRKNRLLIRLGRPYLIPKGTIIRVKSNSIVQRSDILATLVYEKLKTVDIVQGLPKVEEILEARRIKNTCVLSPCPGNIYFKSSTIDIVESNGNIISLPLETKKIVKFTNGDFIQLARPITDGQIDPHSMLSILFNYYRTKYKGVEACKLSFKFLQLFLVNEVQRTYLAQGVKIADKHIEVIVKQMTAKVQVEDSGDTTLLPGEILCLSQAIQFTTLLHATKDTPPYFIPILLGLTKASLNSQSFISAASFQETTRVLTEAAIEGKRDWLVGLKENVIIGRLIPAGTGFNCYNQMRKLYNNTDKKDSESIIRHLIKENLLTLRSKEIL